MGEAIQLLLIFMYLDSSKKNLGIRTKDTEIDIMRNITKLDSKYNNQNIV